MKKVPTATFALSDRLIVKSALNKCTLQVPFIWNQLYDNDIKLQQFCFLSLWFINPQKAGPGLEGLEGGGRLGSPIYLGS